MQPCPEGNAIINDGEQKRDVSFKSLEFMWPAAKLESIGTESPAKPDEMVVFVADLHGKRTCSHMYMQAACTCTCGYMLTVVNPRGAWFS